MRTSPPPLLADEPVAGASAAELPPPAVRRRSWPAVLISTVVVAGLFTALFLVNHRFAFIDDRQADGVPKLVDMGRILASGEWPWLSTHVLNSGGYAVEYQNGVFNPVNLAFGVLMSHMNDAALASFLQLLAHLVLLTAAAAWLGRLVGLSTPWAVAFAVSVGFGPYTVWWGAAWYQAIVSFSWFVLAVAAVVALHLTGRQRYGWLLLVSVFLCLQSGWPLAIPVLALFVVAVVVARLVTRQPHRTTAWIAAWSVGGGLVSLIGLYPLYVSFTVAGRASSINNATNFNVAPLEGLAHAADPSYAGFFYNFDGYALQDLPHFYVAWFVLPVLVFWRPAAGFLRPQVRALVLASTTLLVLTLLGTLGPERLLVFRFPTRFLQYSGFFLLLACALLVAHGRFTYSRRRFAVLGGLLVLQTVNAWQADPAHLHRIVGMNALVALFCLVVVGSRLPRPVTGRLRLLARVSPRRGADAVVALGTVVLLALLAYLHPMARGGDWGFPSDLSTVPPLSQRDYTLWYGGVPPLAAPFQLPSPAPDVAGYYAEFHPSSMGLLSGDRSVNGYSPLGDRYLQAHVPLDDQGNFADTGADKFTAVDRQTGLTWLDLLRVDQVIAVLGPRDDQLRKDLDGSWQRVAQGKYTATYRRAPYDLPGLVSYAAPGVQLGAQEPCRRRNSTECVSVTDGSGPGRVVFARVWFPGYYATLDGKPIDVQRHAGALVAVDLPRGAHGELVLHYRSPGFLPLAGLGIVVLLGLAGAQVALRPRRTAGPARSESGVQETAVLDPAAPDVAVPDVAVPESAVPGSRAGDG
jgi:hypothetical protein